MTIYVSQSILLPGKHKLHLYKKSWETNDEFQGRALCEIEQRITGLRGGSPPAGTEWFRWDWEGYGEMRSFLTHGGGVLIQSTGEPYQNRTIRLPGAYTLKEALRYLKGKNL